MDAALDLVQKGNTKQLETTARSLREKIKSNAGCKVGGGVPESSAESKWQAKDTSGHNLQPNVSKHKNANFI